MAGDEGPENNFMDKLISQYKEGKINKRDPEREKVFKEGPAFLKKYLEKTIHREEVGNTSPFFINKNFTLDKTTGNQTFKEYLENSYIFLGQQNNSEKIKMKDEVLSDLLRELTNKKLSLNRLFEEMRIGQKNNIVSSKEFKRIYRYYFKDKTPIKDRKSVV